MIIVVALVLLVVSIFVCKFNNSNNNFIRLEDICESGKIALVGNGPLTHEDREYIKNFDCVVRFNDMKNRRTGERTDILVTRKGYGGGGIQKYASNSEYAVWPIVMYKQFNTKDYINSHKYKFLNPIKVHEEYSQSNAKVYNRKVFEGCLHSRYHSESKNGPSSGTLVIDELMKSKHIKEIHTFGMNWNGQNWHVDFNNPDMVHNCCSKCFIHETTSSTYLP